MKIFLVAIALTALAAALFVLWRYVATMRGQKRYLFGLLDKILPVTRPLDNGAEPDLSLILGFARDAGTRRVLYDALLMRHRLDLFPEELLTWESIAEADMVFWLGHPNELQTSPDEIELMGTVPMRFPALLTDLHYFVFRFRVNPPHWAANDGWLAGVAGPYNLKAEPIPGGKGTFSRFEPFESRSIQEHAEYSHKLAVGNKASDV